MAGIRCVRGGRVDDRARLASLAGRPRSRRTRGHRPCSATAQGARQPGPVRRQSAPSLFPPRWRARRIPGSARMQVRWCFCSLTSTYADIQVGVYGAARAAVYRRRSGGRISRAVAPPVRRRLHCGPVAKDGRHPVPLGCSAGSLAAPLRRHQPWPVRPGSARSLRRFAGGSIGATGQEPWYGSLSATGVRAVSRAVAGKRGPSV
jgi:hypothetical protein